MIPQVLIDTANGQIGGAINTGDGITGAIITGTGSGTLPLLYPIRVLSLSDAENKGITTTFEPNAHRVVKDFYSIPNTIGIPFYLMLAANTLSIQSQADKTNASGAMKLINFAGGAIRNIILSRVPAGGYTPSTPQFIDTDCINALPNALALQQACFAVHTPLRVLIAARVYDETSATIYAPNTGASNGVAMLMGGLFSDGYVSIGLFAGRIAATAVHVNIGRNKDGALPVNMCFVGSKAVAVDPANPTQVVIDQAVLNSLIDAGYITFTGYPQKAGIFISDDPMAVAQTDDYRSLANCRVIDKMSIVAYQTYINELKNDVDLDADGNIDVSVAKTLEGTLIQNIKLTMGDSISGEPQVFIPVPQNLATGSNLQIKCRVVPKGYLKGIDVELGFKS
jgi:hypothetical protein